MQTRGTDRAAQRRRRRRIGLAVAAVFVTLVVVSLVRDPGAYAASITWGTVWHGWRTSVLRWQYWVLIAVLLVLERRFPAQSRGGMVSRGGAVDLAWIFGAPFFTLTIVAVYLAVLDVVYFHALGGFNVGLRSAIGAFAAAVVAFVLSDFLLWFSHLVRHKIPTFWYFHAVHHAAPTLNALTDNRVHFVEAIISATVVFIPSTLLGLSAPAAYALTIATIYFTAFTHTAIRTNMGPLRFLIVTPQSHRVHHSDAAEHIDKNFATVFSVWDRVFGTQYWGEDEYPPTGIADPHFPLEQSARPLVVLQAYARQIVYPFTQVLHDVGKYRRRPDGEATATT